MTFILNFHGIGACARPFEEGEEPYWISEEQFQNCLDMVQQAGREIRLTFDDGNASDYEIALPALKRRGLSAKFFVLAGKIGNDGYLSASQIAEMSQINGIEIGSHGMDHQPWTAIDDTSLRRELSESKSILEGICGKPIDNVGIPFGRYNRRVLRQLKRHGYKDIYSSDGREKLTDTEPLPRLSVRADDDFGLLKNYINNPPTFLKCWKNELRSYAKSRIPFRRRQQF